MQIRTDTMLYIGDAGHPRARYKGPLARNMNQLRSHICNMKLREREKEIVGNQRLEWFQKELHPQCQSTSRVFADMITSFKISLKHGTHLIHI